MLIAGLFIHGWHAQDFLFFGGAEPCSIMLMMPTVMLAMLIMMLSLPMVMLVMLTIELNTMILRTMCLVIQCIQ